MAVRAGRRSQICGSALRGAGRVNGREGARGLRSVAGGSGMRRWGAVQMWAEAGEFGNGMVPEQLQTGHRFRFEIPKFHVLTIKLVSRH
jgi:hypothetical protein